MKFNHQIRIRRGAPLPREMQRPEPGRGLQAPGVMKSVSPRGSGWAKGLPIAECRLVILTETNHQFEFDITKSSGRGGTHFMTLRAVYCRLPSA